MARIGVWGLSQPSYDAFQHDSVSIGSVSAVVLCLRQSDLALQLRKWV
jgi:hypothetical protein